MKFYVYRYGSNAANQGMNNGPVHVATVEAPDADTAKQRAAQRVTVYNNQHLDARPADEVDAEQKALDDAVEVIE